MTLPGIRAVPVLLLILRLGDILTVGFEQIFLQRDYFGPEAAEVIDTFVYYHGIAGGQWGVAAAWNDFFRGVLYLDNSAMWPLQTVLRQYVTGSALLGDVGAAETALVQSQQPLKMAVVVLATLAGVVQAANRPDRPGSRARRR